MKKQVPSVVYKAFPTLPQFCNGSSPFKKINPRFSNYTHQTERFSNTYLYSKYSLQVCIYTTQYYEFLLRYKMRNAFENAKLHTRISHYQAEIFYMHFPFPHFSFAYAVGVVLFQIARNRNIILLFVWTKFLNAPAPLRFIFGNALFGKFVYFDVYYRH